MLNKQLLNIDDNELVLRLKADDIEAFDALYRKYHKALYVNIFKLAKEEQRAQDILQEVFISLWENRATLDNKKPVANWLYSVSYYTSVRYLKRILKQQLLSEGTEGDWQAFDKKAENWKELKLEMLEKAINQLSPQKRKVLELCKLQGKSYQEAADELNISKHTVKEYLNLAMNSIREYIKNNPDVLALFYSTLLTAKW